MTNRLSRLFLSTAAAGLLSMSVALAQQPAPAAALTPDQQQEALLAGSMLGILLHELGHGMITELKLPIPGTEEDVADEFASFLLVLATKSQSGDDPVAQQALRLASQGSALNWYAMARRRGDQGSAWWGEHSPDMVRFGRIMCILYGGDPETFGAMMDKVGIPQERRDRCVADYRRKWQAWRELLRPHLRNHGDPDFPGDLPADAPGGKVRLDFVPATSPFGRQVEGGLQADSSGLAGLAAGLSQDIVWPRDISIIFRDCDRVNAWWDPRAGTVTMCYNMIELAAKLVASVSSETGVPPSTGGGLAVPSLQQQLAGRWSGQFADGAGGFLVFIDLNADGSYAQTLHYTAQNLTITVRGAWRASPGPGNQILFDMRPQQWNPTQACFGSQCQPLQFPPQVMQAILAGQDTIGTAYGNLTRSR
jgi:hypothetical protein